MTNLIANWPAPANISALTTTCNYGISASPYASNNLALHVGDNQEHVLSNREALRISLNLPREPAWLEQTHTNRCVVVENESNRIADAAITRTTYQPLVIMTADCLPILLCNRQGTEIAAIHAGWKGLLNGIVENTLNKMQSPAKDLLAWVGPAICHKCYPTNNDIKNQFIQRYPFADKAFYTHKNATHANLALLLELILQKVNVPAIYQSAACTFEMKNKYYSYRREPQTGRMATLIWFNQPNSNI